MGKVVVVAAAAVLLSACSGASPQAPVSGGTSVLQPTRPIHLRAAFDDDPTAYVGRFVPDALAVEQVDETAAAQTRCSEFFQHKVVNAGQELDEVVYSSSKVAGSIGVKPFAGVSGVTERGATVRVKYTLTKRMQVSVKDPAGLARCCSAAPDQCTGQVIGEFLMGSGEVYQAAGTKDSLDAATLAKSVTGEVSIKDETAWRRVSSFKNMYFAFLTTATSAGGASEGAADATCGWCDKLPTSLDGDYFCGLSAPAPSEAMARDLAMRNAREQVVKFLGEYLKTEASSEASLVKGYLEDKQVSSAAASGLASGVKDQKWCKAEATNTPEGVKLSAKVLAFFPAAEKKHAAAAAVDAMIEKHEKEPAKDPKHKEHGAALRKLKEKLK